MVYGGMRIWCEDGFEHRCEWMDCAKELVQYGCKQFSCEKISNMSYGRRYVE